jgi:hypothetical protein
MALGTKIRRCTGLGDDEDLVSQILSDQSDRDPSERVTDELFNIRCGQIELDDRNHAQAFAERSDRRV